MSSTATWVEAYIGLGSNLDQPLQQVTKASTDIAALAQVEQLALSPLYSSQPVGPQDQPDYINAVMRIKTSLSALELLRQLQQIEHAHNRVRLERWGARTLDLDVLLYDEQIINLPDLRVPHPEMAHRGFVLYPLADIAPPALQIPSLGSLRDCLAACPANGIQRLPA